MALGVSQASPPLGSGVAHGLWQAKNARWYGRRTHHQQEYDYGMPPFGFGRGWGRSTLSLSSAFYKDVGYFTQAIALVK